jgi:hypothetical protein
MNASAGVANAPAWAGERFFPWGELFAPRESVLARRMERFFSR